MKNIMYVMTIMKVEIEMPVGINTVNYHCCAYAECLLYRLLSLWSNLLPRIRGGGYFGTHTNYKTLKYIC